MTAAAAPSLLAMERACMNAWPALKSAGDGAWLWRWARGYSKRANSVNFLDPGDGADASARIAAMLALSARHGIAPVFRLTPLTPPAVVAELDAQGWPVIEESLVMSMPLTPSPMPAGARDLPLTDPHWLAAQARLAGYDEATRLSLELVLAQVPGEARSFLVEAEGRAVAAALASVHFGLAVYLNVVSDAAERGKGFGRAVMQAALSWSADAGARHAVIQVLADNAPALSLYRALGFVERYRYSYRQPGRP